MVWDENGLTKTYDYHYDNNHRLTKQEITADSWYKNYAWDDAGNLTKRTCSDGKIVEYYWDARNLLTKVRHKVDESMEDLVAYSYDSLGRLYQRTDDDATTTYYFDGLTPVVEIVDDGETLLTKRHRSVPGALGNVLQTYDGTDKVYYAYDRLGNVLAGYDESGDAVVNEVYDAFGYPQSGGALTKGDFAQTTKMFDNTTQLYYFNARWHNPDTPGFISAAAVFGRCVDQTHRTRRKALLSQYDTLPEFPGHFFPSQF